MMDQVIINRAVNIATKNAMCGHPVLSVIWIPPLSACNDPIGSFIVIAAPVLTASQTPFWDR